MVRLVWGSGMWRKRSTRSGGHPWIWWWIRLGRQFVTVTSGTVERYCWWASEIRSSPVNRWFIPLFCLGFNHPFGGAGFRNHPQYVFVLCWNLEHVLLPWSTTLLYTRRMFVATTILSLDSADSEVGGYLSIPRDVLLYIGRNHLCCIYWRYPHFKHFKYTKGSYVSHTCTDNKAQLATKKATLDCFLTC